jgi:type IV secretion system protein VirB10
MKREADEEVPPAVAPDADLGWNRRSVRLGNLQRILAVTGSSIVCCFVMGWYAMQGRAAVQPAPAARAAARGDYVLPRLNTDRPAPPGVADPAVADGDAPDPPDLVAEGRPAAAPPVLRALRPAPQAATAHDGAPPAASAGNLIWRPSTDEARASDPRVIRRDPGPEPVGFRAVSALRLPSLDFLLGKGTVVRCSLETAIDSELPGLAACLTSADVYGANGRHVLLARGTRLIGEVHSDLRTGRSRVLVVWVEARTPDGLLVPLASPGTDELGRTGVRGEVDTHFLDRFGAALLISAIDAGLQGVANRHAGGTVVVSTQGTDAVMTEVLRSTVAIPPTVRVAAGEPVSVLVAQDVDFGAVAVPGDRTVPP